MSALEDHMCEYLRYSHEFDEFEGTYPMSKYCYICGSLMATKKGMHGKFRGCSNYPKCNYTENCYGNE